MFHLINDNRPTDSVNKKYSDKNQSHKNSYVAILTREEWEKQKHDFDLGIDIAQRDSENSITKAEVNYDSITGTFSIPNRKDFSQPDAHFAFALDERGIIFIDDGDTTERIVMNIKNTKMWRLPSLERFIYDFLDQIVSGDLQLMNSYERQLDEIENAIFDNQGGNKVKNVNTIRNNIREIKIHYEQLLDLAEVFEENENNFFINENLHYFRLFINKIERLRDSATAVYEQAIQVRDLFKTHLDVKQNKIVTTLTVVTTIFMPLTLIVGWYGMNFRYMPELEYKWSYPIVILLCLAIVTCSLYFFKHKKWM